MTAVCSADRPWLVVGTVPDPEFPLTLAACACCGRELRCGQRIISIQRGTPALAATAAIAGQYLDGSKPAAALLLLAAGDTGSGEGSQRVYAMLADQLHSIMPRGITFHYLLPDVDNHNRVLAALENMPERPLLVADAGHMYAAKMSGYADRYDLFTPDIGELAFLADPEAPHPFYTRNFLLADEDMAENLIAGAHATGNSAKYMLVKGKTDRLVHEGTIALHVDAPDVPMLEPIGGTGDTLTGLVTALLAHGLPMREACEKAMKTNRLMGDMACPTPATSVEELLECLPRALEAAMLPYEKQDAPHA